MCMSLMIIAKDLDYFTYSKFIRHLELEENEQFEYLTLCLHALFFIMFFSKIYEYIKI